MKKLFIVANWKSNKTQFESIEWIQEFQISNFKFPISNKEIIICPSFTSLSILKNSINKNKLSFRIGAQDISPFNEGAYTGEVTGKQIKEFAEYVIIGHSERRKYFNEADEMINKKIEMAIKYDLVPILCVSELSQIANVKTQNYNSNLKTLIIAYEPLFAIGSGNSDTSENVDKVAFDIKSELNGVSVLYGGSVTANNVRSFTYVPNIDGVLVGEASLDAVEFSKIIKNS